MKQIKYFLGALVLLIFASCKENEPFLFNNGATLQFGPPLSAIYQPGSSAAGASSSYTFFYQPDEVKKDTVFFNIYAIGGVSSVDRSFKLKQVEVEEVENAVAGKHYVSFDDPDVSKNFVIKAGEMHSQVPVILLRDESLKTVDAVLSVEIVENENFKKGESNFIWRRLDFTDRINKPAAWSGYYQNNFYGAYSARKHKLMIDVTGELWDQAFMVEVHKDLAEIGYYMSVVKAALIEYNNEHPNERMKDEFDNYITFP